MMIRNPDPEEQPGGEDTEPVLREDLTRADLPRSNASLDPGSLALLVELSSAAESLTTGAEIVGHLEPPARFTLPVGTMVFASLLVLSWLLFLVSWRRREADL